MEAEGYSLVVTLNVVCVLLFPCLCYYIVRKAVEDDERYGRYEREKKDADK